MVEFFQQQISAIREKFPHIRWIIYAVLGIQFLWRLWNGAGDMIDAYSHFQFLAQHRQETIDGLKTGIDAIFSPIGSIVTMFLGIAYLIADNRARKAEKQRAPLIAEATHPNVDRRTSDLEPQRGVSTQHKTLTKPASRPAISPTKSNLSAGELVDLCEGRSEKEEEQITTAYFGQMLEASGVVSGSVNAFSNDFALVSLRVSSRYRAALVHAQVKGIDRVRSAVALRPEATVKVIGTISEISKFSVTLRDCDITASS